MLLRHVGHGLRRILRWAVSKDGAQTIVAIIALYMAFWALVDRDCIVLRSPSAGYSTADVIRFDGVILHPPKRCRALMSSPDFEMETEVTLPMAWDVSAAPEGEYSLVVEAYRNILGFVSALVQRIEVVVQIDRTKPDIQVTGIPEHRILRGEYDIQAQAVGATITHATLDGTTSLPVRPAETSAITLHTEALRDGSHSLSVDAIDEAGNANSQDFVFIVDNRPFQLTSVGLVEGQILKGDVDLILAADGGDLKSGVVTISRTPDSPDCVTPAAPSSPNVTTTVARTLDHGEKRVTLDSASICDGDYVLEVVAESLAGEADTYSQPLRIDNTPPILCPRFPVDEVYTEGTLYIDFASSEPAKLDVLVNDEPTSSGVLHLHEYVVGDVISVKCVATDEAGNVCESDYRLRVSESWRARLGQLKHQLEIFAQVLVATSSAPLLLVGAEREETRFGVRLGIPQLAYQPGPLAVPIFAPAIQRGGLEGFWIGYPRVRHVDEDGETNSNGFACYGSEICVADLNPSFDSPDAAIGLNLGLGTVKSTQRHLVRTERDGEAKVETWEDKLLRAKWLSLGLSADGLALWFPGLRRYLPQEQRFEFSAGIRLWAIRTLEQQRTVESGQVIEGKWSFRIASEATADTSELFLWPFLEFSLLFGNEEY